MAVNDGVAQVAVLSNTSASAANAARSAPRAKDMARAIRSMGIPAEVLGDFQVARGGLTEFGLAMVPYHAEMPKDVSLALENFLSSGGKAVFFYWVPDNLRGMLGVRGGAYVHEKQTRRQDEFQQVRFVAGRLEGSPRVLRQASWNIFAYKPVRGTPTRVAAWWHDSRGRKSSYPAVMVSPYGAVMTHVLLSPHGEAQKRFLLSLLARFLGHDVLVEALQADLDRARNLGGEEATAGFEKLLKKGMWRALDMVQTVVDKARRDHMASAPSRGRELRAIWRQDPWVTSWNASMKELKKQGFNAFFPNMSSSEAHYPSLYLPQSKRSLKKGDQMKKALRAGRRHGIDIHLWRINYLLRENPELQMQMAQENRIQIMSNGQPYTSGGGYALCPSHPLNKELEINIMLEAAVRYKPAGIHMDFIRYPSTETCFCDTCRTLFQKKIGKTFEAWPGDVLDDDAMSFHWRQFRRDQITDLVRRTSEEIRDKAPGVQISAAVFVNWNTVRESLGQDWKLWVEQGYLDFVCPMNYTPEPETFRAWVNAQTHWVAGRIPLIAGIGVFRIASVEGVEEQVRIARQQGADGYILFDHPRALGPVDEGLALGANRTPPGGLPLAGLSLDVSVVDNSWSRLLQEGVYPGGKDLSVVMDWRKNFSKFQFEADTDLEVLLVDGFDNPLLKLGFWNPAQNPLSVWCLRLPEAGSSRILVWKKKSEDEPEFFLRSRPLRSVSLAEAHYRVDSTDWIWGP